MTRQEYLSEVLNADLPQQVRADIAGEQRRFEEKRGADQPRHVLLIGGAGYIGAPVASALLDAGYHVRNMDVLAYPTAHSTTPLMLRDNYSFMRGDLCDLNALDSALEGVTDVVVLGGLVGDPITKKFPDVSNRINLEGLGACLDHLSGKGLDRVLFVSTCSNYGLMEDGKLADETSSLKPLSLYAEAKVAMEKKLLGLKGSVDFSPTVLRFATAFGFAPRMRFDLTVNEFTRDIFLDKDLLVYDADTWRPYCHVRDFARLIRRVLELPAERTAFEVFNAGGDANNHTKQSLIDIITARLPSDKISYKEHGTDPRNYRVNFAKVHETLLFEPKWTVESGVEELIVILKLGLFEDYDDFRNFYGNYDLPPSLR